VDKELEQMHVHVVEQRKQLLVKRNNILLLVVLLINNITLIWHRKSENQ
jgi:hypothetical protein